MIPIFNTDMARRIADLHQAVEDAREIHCHYEPEARTTNSWIAPRIVVEFGEHKFSLGVEMANAVADQFEVNGKPVFASRLRPPSDD